ncbi:TnpV protein [Eubacterium sp.]|uniref:TnpV protein n=1 Tax=Eubacterium sp. TaxID=142586 RepID=UPI00351F98F7
MKMIFTVLVPLYVTYPVVFLKSLITKLGGLKTKGELQMEEKKLTYHEGADGMLYPNLEMPKEKVSITKVGRYGMMAAQYLKENEGLRYNTLYRLGRLVEKMMEVDEEANSLMDTLMEDYLKKHKPQNPSSTMEMWKIREQAKMIAEEVVLHQIVYRFH